jgi:hypothetical protein
MQQLRKRINLGRKLIPSIKNKVKKKDIKKRMKRGRKRHSSLNILIVVYACRECTSQPSFFADIHSVRPVFKDMLI